MELSTALSCCSSGACSYQISSVLSLSCMAMQLLPKCFVAGKGREKFTAQLMIVKVTRQKFILTACKLTHNPALSPVTHEEVYLQAEVERLEQLVDAEAARGDYILEAAQDNIDGFAQALDQQADRQQRSRRAELQRQRQGLTRAAAQELVNERRQRMTTLKEVTCKPCAGLFAVVGWAGQRRG